MNDSHPVRPSKKSKLHTHLDKLPKWAQPVLALGTAVVVLALALFIGGKFYYQVSPLAPSSDNGQYTGDGQSYTPPDELTDDQYYEKYAFPFDKALASSVFSYPDDCVSYYAAYSSDPETDGDTQACLMLSKQGPSVIQHPFFVSDSYYSSYHSGGVSDVYTGMGTVSVDNLSYLVFFQLVLQDKKYQLNFTGSALLAGMSKVSSIATIPFAQGVYAEDSLIAQITGVDASGHTVAKYFAPYIGKYSDGSYSVPLEKNADGTFSVNLTTSGGDVPKASFLVPYSASAGGTASDRDLSLETESNLSPIYFRSGCGLEESYSDAAFWIGSQATLGINFGYNSILHITTTRQGYVSDQWGKILKNVSMADFREVVGESTAARSSSPVEMLTIAGYTVKHTGPIIPTRTCEYGSDGDSYDMYQTVKNGAVLTFTAMHYPRYPSTDTTSPEKMQKIIEQVLNTLTFSLK